jgi:hypothetical protein
MKQPPQYALGPRLNTSGMAAVIADDFTSLDTSVWNYDFGDGSDYGLWRWEVGKVLLAVFPTGLL